MSLKTFFVDSFDAGDRVDAYLARSIPELMERIEPYDTKDVYVIGGASVYRQLLPYCDTAHVTKLDYEYEADAFFPDLDADPEWKITGESDEQTYFDIPYTFVRYERIKAEDEK